MKRSGLAWLSWIVPCAFVFACGDGDKTSGGLGSGGGDGGQGSGLHGQGGEAGTMLAGSATGGTGCADRCSADLHEVVDCHDHVIKTCSDTTACGKGGECVAPCTAAEQARSTIGCEFYSVLPEAELAAPGSCFAVLVANTWTAPITITADHGGAPFDVSTIRIPHGSGSAITYDPLPNGQLPAGELGVVFLAGTTEGGGLHVDCPAGVTPGLTAADAAITETGFGAAFHVTTSAPVAAYDMYPYGGAKSYIASATLLVPTPAWGDNYVAVDPFAESPLNFTGSKPGIQIVAREAGTKVTIDPVTAIDAAAGVAGTAAGTPVSYMLGRGQVLQIVEDAELAGSAIQSDKPISVWGTLGAMLIPVSMGDSDAAHQQLLPVKALGHAYVAARFRDRTAGSHESDPWTFVGAVDGTELTYDPAPPTGAPSMLAKGEVLRFSTSDPFSVKSQDDKHPFYVGGHMTGCEGTACNGGPEWVSTVPPAQWLERYLFLTDPTYGNTNLVFIRQKNKNGTFDDVTLDCAGKLSGWAPVGGGGVYELARVDLVIGGAPEGSCGNGVHAANSATPFGLTVWGWDDAVSYGYPAGMSTQTINDVVVPAVPK